MDADVTIVAIIVFGWVLILSLVAGRVKRR
jgi:hypothetical protein